MTALAHVFSLALLHFVSQGTLVAALLWIALAALRNRPANIRYLLSCAALAVLLVLPAVTACVVYDGSAPVSAVTVTGGGAPTAAPAQPAGTGNSWEWLEAWVVVAWCAGVFFFSARLLWGSRQVRLMRQRGEAAGEAVRAAVERMAGRMGVKRPVEVLTSLAAGPSVVGLLRPAILLPAATILGLTPEQLEAVLAHELAHIRRYDYLVNVVQMLAEVLLFYHPAVWWISGRIRLERELCCDDEAVRACGDSVCYARALAALERIRVLTPRFGLGGTDGPLGYRIKRVLGLASAEHLASQPPGVVALFIALVYLAATLTWGHAQAQPDGLVLRVDPTASGVLLPRVSGKARMGSDLAQADVKVPFDQSVKAKDAVQVSGETHFSEPVLEPIPILGSQFAGSWGAVTVEFQTPLGERSQPEEAELKRREAELAVLESFEGRILRGIRLAGLPMSARAFVEEAQVPLRDGDTLTRRILEATLAAVRRFDEHLGERWSTVEPNGVELTIFAPGARNAMGSRPVRDQLLVDAIEFSGASGIPRETLRALIFSQQGEVYEQAAVQRDLIALRNTNRFSDVQVKTESGDRGGISLRFFLTERP